jgi:hypothetical protein
MPLVALAALIAAHLFDFASFVLMTARHGLEAEINPVVVALAEGHGIVGLTLAKFVSVVLVGTTVAIIAPKRRRLAMAVLVVGIAAGVVGGISNIATL